MNIVKNIFTNIPELSCIQQLRYKKQISHNNYFIVNQSAYMRAMQLYSYSVYFDIYFCQEVLY